MPSPVILILGAGANVGAQTARLFAKYGYKVAVASRTTKEDLKKEVDLAVSADFSKPGGIKTVFDEVKSKIGTPSVVVYNAAAVTFTPNDPLSLSLADFERDLAINVTSPYFAAQEAVLGFRDLPSSIIKTFIYTGNGLNVVKPMPPLLNLGIGKNASAHFVEGASMAYTKEGFNFYYSDERKADGSVAGAGISGSAHAEFYYELSQKKEQGPWDATFVPGKGYVDFAEK